ncbi:outer membrane lipoprotein carrier protein LolA [Desulfurispirillum indicum]|uniref:LolA family protein n=1 Tax=Desulfurispirillum indicum TaxID=936456 RepID=UPI001CFBDBCA|nr:outer membrane lipoprotein carrier protein LolA [Desulfurispirillum indicum]UCZ56257.1 outer membrane lipoprotein carrier protein LolA [Desulfurispirillum indicum]
MFAIAPLLVAAIFFVATPVAAASDTALDILTSYRSLQASFSQQTHSSDGFVQEGRGTFSISKDARSSMWEYTRPERQKYLIRDHTLWLYLYDERELTIMDIGEFESMSFSMLDREAMERIYHVQENTRDTLVLESKEEPVVFITVLLENNLPRTLIYEGASLDITTITFDGVRPNISFPARHFEADTPRGWEVIRQ